jgi:DNA-binding CsgD family transcriptional regulator
MTTQFKFRGTTYALASKGELTNKEEVEATAIMLGLTYKESAKQRGVSPETAKCQRASAKSKVGARSQSEFIMEIISRGWLVTFIKGVLRRAARFANTNHRKTKAQRQSNPLFPLFCHKPNADLPFFQLTPVQQEHTAKLSAENAVRYLAYLAALKAHGGAS